MSMVMKRLFSGALAGFASAALMLTTIAQPAYARDIEYKQSEVSVYVNPGEPTQVKLPGKISGGFKKKLSSLSLDKKDSDLIIFAGDNLTDAGEAIIVRLEDGRSYSVRIRRSSTDNERDDVVRIEDARKVYIADEEEVPAYKNQEFSKSPSTSVAGLLREMVLVSEFGKKGIPGYRVSDSYKGEMVLSDGTMDAQIDKIFIGPNLWGYVLDASNKLGQSQKINPASFRLDGTRAVSAERWELAPRPMDIEQQISSQHRGKVYVITRSRKTN